MSRETLTTIDVALTLPEIQTLLGALVGRHPDVAEPFRVPVMTKLAVAALNLPSEGCLEP